MSLLRRLRDSLREPLLAGVDFEERERVEVHAAILARKKMLRGVFDDIYRLLLRLDERHLSGEGKRVEIGAGVSRFRELCLGLLLTDLVPAPHLDMVLDAQAMALPDRSVRAFYGLNCFHHFPDPRAFFRELERVLVPGGGCILVEPYHGPLAARFYRDLFDTEGFDRDQEGWESGAGVMEGANQALSWIVFRRDRERFRREFPALELAATRRLGSYPRYLLSGGLNFRQLLPDWTIPALRGAERLLAPLAPLLALHWCLVLRRNPGVRPR